MRSWWCRQTSTTRALTWRQSSSIRAPFCGCRRTRPNSCSVSLPGLFRIGSGTAILPMSCSSPASPASCTSGSDSSSWRARAIISAHDRHRMHVGVFIRGLQPYQADQRVGMAQHRGGDFVHQVRCMRGVDGLAHARVVEHADHGGLGTAAEQGGVADFLLRATRAGEGPAGMVTGRTAAAETAASSGRSRPLPASIQTSFTALSRRRCRSDWLSSRKPPFSRTGGPATSRKGSGRTYRGEAGLPECVSARWARPRDWARWLSP